MLISAYTYSACETMKSVFVLAFVTFIALCGGLTAPACICDRRECEFISEIDCPGLGIVVWDPCKYVSQIYFSHFSTLNSNRITAILDFFRNTVTYTGT